jgi:hypothetical protein
MADRSRGASWTSLYPIQMYRSKLIFILFEDYASSSQVIIKKPSSALLSNGPTDALNSTVTRLDAHLYKENSVTNKEQL